MTVEGGAGMSGTPDWAAAINAISTMSDLGRELKRRRIAAGFDSLPELLRNTKSGYPLPRSSAYAVEEGRTRSRWVSVEAHLRACSANAPEIELWHEAHGRALLNYGTQPQGDPVTIPTAKQLAEMGSEQGARILSEMDTETAADLLRRIDLKNAVKLVPEIHLSVVLGLLAEVGQARITKIFEQIVPDQGAELLAEMKTEDALTVLDELGTRRAAELVGAMPRGRAARLLRSIAADQVVRIIAAMDGRHAAALLLELDAGILEKLLDSSGTQAIAGVFDWMDSGSVSELLTERMSDERALEIMAKMNASPLANSLGRVGTETAIRLVSRMTTARLAEIFNRLPRNVQVELLTRSLSVQQAQEVLLEWVERTPPDDRITVVWLVEEMPSSRMAEIVCGMETPDAVLFLAIINRRIRQQILAEIPTAEAASFTAELTPDGIARHLSLIPSGRANRYLSNIQISKGVILSKVDPAAAIEMLLEENTFTAIAGELKRVPPPRVALMLETIQAETAAYIMADLPIENAERAIVAMDPEFAVEMVRCIQQNVSFRFWDQHDISAEQWEKIRARRQEFVDRLQEALGQAG
jgi:Mg/Co/Ni transporter MgtE